ncbi:MAG TPA: malto-oligosyltrehalose synthase [Opitutaceae bacterium]|jgi:(1->4)-alpha-D-glucan 1-alpha-D-glucosylmutase
MPLVESGHVPASAYRVQLHGKFTFADLAALDGYFSELGISDMYLSPVFTAVPGSQHGYDVTDYGEINPELGGYEGFKALSKILHDGGRGIILDFVPNHMGIAGMLNQWWRDVLEYGPSSRYASFFDIQWKTEQGHGRPRVLVPLLLDHYGKVLERGEIKLIYDKGFSLRYGETALPVSPESYPDILQRLDPSAADLLGHGSQGLKERLESLVSKDPHFQEALDRCLQALNGTPGDAGSFDSLHAIIERQYYRLARWQAGAHEINYRRFFAIDTLVGLHMEVAEVFHESHAMVGKLIEEGAVDGLRIDHIDGLRQPQDYLHRVQLMNRPDASRPLYVLVEKILARGEMLPAAWPVHGTTGYEFIERLAGILVDASQESRFDAIYRAATGDTRTYQDRVIRSKRLIIVEMFANAISNLGAELVQILADDRLWRDLTRHELTTAVSELVVHLSVYRTYRRRFGAVTDQDRALLEDACARTIADNPRADPEPIAFVKDLLVGNYPPARAPAAYRERILSWALTFQQYTGAIMAKSVEDTAYYTYNRFVALNEVGGDPGVFGGSVDAFHKASLERQEREPFTLLTTSTHDSKLSEDVRARLYALSEVATEWEAWVKDWSQKTAGHTTLCDGQEAPDALDQYRFFQVLLGAWPLADEEVDDVFRGRLKDYFRKAVNEAKRHTSILNGNEAYLVACDHFVDSVTTTASSNTFMASFLPSAARIGRLGMVNSLVQLVLKCTVPGVPDIYQGNEIWDFSLVDPDNRRPVDFGLRQTMIGDVIKVSYPTLLENWRQGGIKLRVTRDLLRLRRAYPALFASGLYRPVGSAGSFSGHVVAFVREHEERSLLVVVPRLTAKIGSPPVGSVWDDTRLGEAVSVRAWRNALTGQSFASGEPLFLRSLFGEMPFAVLQSWEDQPS